MSKTLWTPGPWILSPCGDILGNRNTWTDNGLVAAMCSDRKDAEGAANARLIEAAPEMAEALAYCVAVLAGFRNEGCTSEVVCSAHDEARALLARIRGETP